MKRRDFLCLKISDGQHGKKRNKRPQVFTLPVKNNNNNNNKLQVKIK